MARKLPIAVLASGNGSNFQALIDAIKRKQLDAEIRLLITNNPQAYALERAAHAAIRTVVLPDLSDRDAYADLLIEHLRACGTELVCLAGFMRILSSKVVQAFCYKLINIHPALLPKFPGLHAIEQAVEAGETETGCTIHFVDEGVDTGPIIAQTKVPIQPDDTIAELTTRVHQAEHQLYPRVVQWFAEDRIVVQDGHVMVK